MVVEMSASVYLNLELFSSKIGVAQSTEVTVSKFDKKFFFFFFAPNYYNAYNHFTSTIRLARVRYYSFLEAKASAHSN